MTARLSASLVLLGLLAAGCSPFGPSESHRLPDAGQPGPSRWDFGDSGFGFDSGTIFEPHFRLDHGRVLPVGRETVLVSADGGVVFVSDQSRASIYRFDLTTSRVDALPLDSEARPGRMALDAEGGLHVVLAGGRVLTVGTGANLAQRYEREVCAEAQGIIYDPADDVLRVACAEGQLVTLPIEDLPPSERLPLPDDLRDVVLLGEGFALSRFRSAEVLLVARDGGILRRLSPETLTLDRDGGAFAPNVGYRLVTSRDGDVYLSHQLSSTAVISEGGGRGSDAGSAVFAGDSGFGGSIGSGAYGPLNFGQPSGGCSGVVRSAVSRLSPSGEVRTRLVSGALPVDLAVSETGQILVVTAGSFGFVSTSTARFFVTKSSQDAGPFQDAGFFDAGQPDPTSCVAFTHLPEGVSLLAVAATAPEVRWNGNSLKAPSADGGVILPVGASRFSRAAELFQRETAAGITCASCHPEGGEDGFTWNFSRSGKRRTQTMLGGVMNAVPFHRDGAVPSMDALMTDVFMGRMSGRFVNRTDVAALENWVQTLSAPLSPSASGDPLVAAKGQEVFGRDCESCHSDAQLGSATPRDVGTGGMFETAPLTGIAYRAPYLHDGRAATLDEAIALHTALTLTAEDRAALLAFVRSR